MYKTSEDFLFKLKDFFEWYKNNKNPKCNFVTAREIGCFKIYYLFRLPFLVKQIRSNFREKWFLGKIGLFTCRHKITIKSPIIECETREKRIYLNIGITPYCDAKTGISRVLTNLAIEGVNYNGKVVVPVYCDIVTGGYRVANAWLRSKDGVKDKNNIGKNDSVITVREGDWLIHTNILLSDIENNKEFRRKFKEAGGREGAVLYDLIPVRFPQYVSQHAAISFARWLIYIANMNGIFAISKSVLEDWKHWCSERSIQNVNATFFYLGANFHKKSRFFKQLPQELEKYPYFVQVSTIEPRKGYVQLLDAFDLLWSYGKDIGLVIVGWYGWKMESFAKRVKQHPLYGKKLFWLEGISDDMLAAVYNKSFGVIMASEAEGFGLGIIEGLSYGKKVIARDIPIFREVGGDSLLYFQGKKPEAIAEVIEKVMSGKDGIALPIYERYTTWKDSFNSFMIAFNELNSKSA